MLKLCLTVILLGCVTQINGANLPVFIWGRKQPSNSPALNHLSSDEFTTLIDSQSDKYTLTVVFVENSLSVEDFSQCRIKSEICFENLNKIDQKSYLTSVEDPVKALELSYDEAAQKSISLSNNGELSDEIKSERILFFNLEDVESPEDFAKHDKLIIKLYNSIAAKRENVIAIYTARHPSFAYSSPLVRVARDAEASKHKEPVKAETKDIKVFETSNGDLLMALSKMTIAVTLDKKQPVISVIDLTKATVTSTTEPSNNSMEVTLEEGEHHFHISLHLSNTWKATSFAYNKGSDHPQKLKISGGGEMSASQIKSFGCSVFQLRSHNMRIAIEDLQIQPEFDTTKLPLKGFSAYGHVDCVGFYSGAIWSGLLVSMLMVVVLSCGITAILDIRTMDRFDDPKGKTITVPTD